jgi:hypothetical protein
MRRCPPSMRRSTSINGTTSSSTTSPTYDGIPPLVTRSDKSKIECVRSAAWAFLHNNSVVGGLNVESDRASCVVIVASTPIVLSKLASMHKTIDRMWRITHTIILLVSGAAAFSPSPGVGQTHLSRCRRSQSPPNRNPNPNSTQ